MGKRGSYVEYETFDLKRKARISMCASKGWKEGRTLGGLAPST